MDPRHHFHGLRGVASMVSRQRLTILWSGLHGNVESLCLPSNQHHHSYLMSQLQLPWYLPTSWYPCFSKSPTDGWYSRLSGKASVTFALKNMYMGILEKNATQKSVCHFRNSQHSWWYLYLSCCHHHRITTLWWLKRVLSSHCLSIYPSSHMLSKLATLFLWHV